MERRVTDKVGLLTSSEIKQLEAELAELEASKGGQLAILIISSTGRETIEQYSIRVVDKWKLGRDTVDDGVLLLVVKDDRKLRIEVGYGLEGAIPDALAKRIIEQIILPHFRDGDFYQGIEEGTEAIISLINGEDLPKPSKSNSGGDSMESPYIVLLFASISIGIIGLVTAGTYLSKKIGRWKSNFIILGFIFLVIWVLSGVIQVAIFVSLLVFVVMVLQGGSRGGGHGGAGTGGY
ncbi:MAG: TPM domain-containing protein, partial [Cyclobacteriaceae bacterium]